MKTCTSLAVATAAIFGACQAQAADCADLKAVKLAGTTISSAQITGPDFTSPGSGLSAPTQVKQQFCRVTGLIAPTTKFEVWLPVGSAWNGKFQGVGNGGMAGGIAYSSMRNALDGGYAVVSSDLGHEGGPNDGSFAIGAPEKVRDWGHRATHEMTVAGKAITAAFYGKSPSYTYFIGCSGGGRQGMMQAQRYPDDYDGILAGDPTIDFSHLTAAGRLWVALTTLRTPGAYIPAEKIPTIANAVVAACDHLDGVKDGVLEDPRQCKFQPASLKCTQGDRADCLTAPQVTALEKIYGGAKTSDGKQIYPGYSPGGELGSGGWGMYVSGTAPFQSGHWGYGSGFVKGMVFEDLKYDPLTFDYDKDIAKMDNKPILGETFAQAINGTNPDLSGFKKSGGKLLLYHGWSDPGVAPMSTVNYYAAAIAKQGGLAQTQEFFRLFMVPGMQHCGGGPGANVFTDEAKSALEAWVEKGTAPRTIVATKYVDDKRDQGVAFTHPLCPYPQTAHLSGSGKGDRAADFVCK